MAKRKKADKLFPHAAENEDEEDMKAAEEGEDEEDTVAEDEDDEDQPAAEDGEDDEEETAAEDGDDEDQPAAKKESKAARKARLSERKRCQSILTSKAAKGRMTLAHELAFNTNMSPKKAASILGTAPQNRTPDNGFTAAMRNQGNPSVGNGGGKAAKSGLSEDMQKRFATK